MKRTNAQRIAESWARVQRARDEAAPNLDALKRTVLQRDLCKSTDETARRLEQALKQGA